MRLDFKNLFKIFLLWLHCVANNNSKKVQIVPKTIYSWLELLKNKRKRRRRRMEAKSHNFYGKHYTAFTVDFELLPHHTCLYQSIVIATASCSCVSVLLCDCVAVCLYFCFCHVERIRNINSYNSYHLL